MAITLSEKTLAIPCNSDVETEIEKVVGRDKNYTYSIVEKSKDTNKVIVSVIYMYC